MWKKASGFAQDSRQNIRVSMLYQLRAIDHPTDRHCLYSYIHEDMNIFIFDLVEKIALRIFTHQIYREDIHHTPDVQIKSLNKCSDARGAKNELLVYFDRNAFCIRTRCICRWQIPQPTPVMYHFVSGQRHTHTKDTSTILTHWLVLRCILLFLTLFCTLM